MKQWDDAMEGCNGMDDAMKGAMEGCNGRIEWKDAMEGCNGRMQ